MDLSISRLTSRYPDRRDDYSGDYHGKLVAWEPELSKVLPQSTNRGELFNSDLSSGFQK